MSGLSAHVDGYVALRRALGYRPDKLGRRLHAFVASLDASGLSTVTVDAALAWAAQASTVAASAARLTNIRGFARYLSGFDPATQVPPVGLVRSGKTRQAPHIYTPAEIAGLMEAAGRLEPAVWAATMATLIGLMGATGLASRRDLPARPSRRPQR